MNFEWPFLHSQALVNGFITNLEKSLDIHLSLNCRREFSYLVAILLMRKNQGYKVKSLTRFFSSNIDLLLYNKLDLSLEELRKTNNIIFTIPEKILLTNAFKHLQFRYTYNIDMLNNEQNFHRRNESSDNKIENFIIMLDNKLKGELRVNKELSNSLRVYFNKKINVLHSSCYLKQTKRITTNHVKKKHLMTFLQVEEVYSQWTQKYKITHHVSNEEIVNIVMLIEATRIYKKITQKKVLIITDEGDCLESYISAVIEGRFGNKISVQSMNTLNIKNGSSIESNHDIDFIIATIPFKFNSTPVVQIQSTVTERDFSNIKEYLEA
ncbi:hypothetical protein Q4571_16910 [Bacillus thuringiensis]|nr:hypothetical protein [Bacillus thuringiensis]